MAETKYDVFVSYSRKDSDIAERICAAFDRNGIRYFIDRQGIGGGFEFPAVLAEAIVGSRIFLFLGSRNSYVSKYTNSEITFAFNKKEKKSIIPYLIDNSPLPVELEFVFSAINRRNMKDHPIETVLIPDILRLLGKEPASLPNTNTTSMPVFIPWLRRGSKLATVGCIIAMITIALSLLTIWKSRRHDNKYISDDSIAADSLCRNEAGTEKDNFELHNFSEGMAAIRFNDEWGYIDTTGIMAIKPKYDYAGYFRDGLAPVRLHGRNGFIDKSGKMATPFIYDSFCYDGFHEGLAAVELNGKYGYIDKSSKMVIPSVYFSADIFSEGLAGVRIDDKEGFIDKEGNMVIQPIYNNAQPFSEGLAGVELNGKVGFIDKSGTLVIPPIYDCLLFPSFNEGLACVGVDDKYGYIDKSGTIAIRPAYDYASDFSEGLAGVKIDDKWGYIDKSGVMVIQPIYDFVYGFSDGLAVVGLNGKCGYIDKTGTFVIPPIYESAGHFNDGWARVRLRNSEYFIDRRGNMLRYKFDIAEYINNRD